MQENYIVMLPSPEIGFYIQLESDKPVYQLTCFDQFSVLDFELTAEDSSSQKYTQLKEINHSFGSLKELFNQLEDRVSPMIINEFHLNFENKHNLSFITGELSARFDSKEFLHQFAVELLDNCAFDGKSMFQKLTQRTNCYIEISIEDQDSFEPIALAK
jgi:hypothetical protein